MERIWRKVYSGLDGSDGIFFVGFQKIWKLVVLVHQEDPDIGESNPVPV
jgi:hypothetical protein